MVDKRYTLRRDEWGTWSVIDMEIDFPAVVRDKILICLDEEEAADAANLLNMIERLRSEGPARRVAASGTPNPFLLPIR
jgi:hypothetical protein